MAHRSDKWSNNTNIGCIWGLINMFNFRRGSSKMLPERRSGTRKNLGSWYSRSRVRLLTEPEQNCDDLDEARKPILMSRSAEVPQSCSRVVTPEPHPSDSSNSSDVSGSSTNEMRTSVKGGPDTPIFFQDVKKRLRLFLWDSKKNQRSKSLDGESGEQGPLTADFSCTETMLTPKEPLTINEPRMATMASDTDTSCAMEEPIFPRKPKIDFVDLLGYGDDDKNLTFTISKSSRNLRLLSGCSQSSSPSTSGNHEDIIIHIDHVAFADANQVTDVNFFRSSILNLETSSSSGVDTTQTPERYSRFPDGQMQGAIISTDISTPKDFSYSNDNGATSLTNIYTNEVSDIDNGFYGECGYNNAYLKTDHYEKLQSHMAVGTSQPSRAIECDGIKPEKSSPISVLQPIFHERFVRPESLPLKHAQRAIPPRRISFEDSSISESGDLSVLNIDNQVKTCINNEKFKYEYLGSLLQASGLCHTSVSAIVKSPSQLLDPMLYDEVETPCEEIPDDLKLFFDCVNEVLVDIYERSSSPMPWVSFYKPGTSPFPGGENLIKEAWRGLNCIFVPHSATTLDEIVEKEFEERPWTDIRYGAEETGFDFSDLIMENLLEEFIFELCEST